MGIELCELLVTRWDQIRSKDKTIFEARPYYTPQNNSHTHEIMLANEIPTLLCLYLHLGQWDEKCWQTKDSGWEPAYLSEVYIMYVYIYIYIYIVS